MQSTSSRALVGLVALAVACTGEIGGAPARDDAATDAAAARDASVDAGGRVDAALPPTDAGIVPSADAGTDASSDAGFADAGTDAPSDPGHDAASADAGTDAPSDAGRDAAAADAGTDAPIDAGQDAPSDAGRDAALDASTCGTTTLASSITTTLIAGAVSGTRAFALGTDGALVGWYGGGAITLQRIDAAGATLGAPIAITGDGLWGVAASSDTNGALVSRGDELVLVLMSAAGAPIHEEILMGGVPHNVTYNEWFGTVMRAGRLDWTGSRWLVYSTLQKLWPDGVAHYGDTLRAFTPLGTLDTTYWDWGCSHSLDVRLSHDASGLPTPVCASDCYPGKGVFYDHTTQVFLDSSGDCMGYVAQHLGGVAPVAAGSWVGWTSAEGRSSQDPALALVGASVSAPIWLSSDLSDASAMHLAVFEGGLVAAWNEGGSGHIVRLDATGAMLGAVESIDATLLAGADDFLVLPSGDVGWAAGPVFARLHACR